MERYLVTGGAGFIGSHIAEELVRRRFQVRVVDNLISGKKENLAPFFDKIEFIEGDIRDFDLCRRVCHGVDIVLHQAALPSVPRSIEDPLTTNEINIKGTLNLLVASTETRVRRFVFASSSSVYGDDAHLPKKEGLEGTPLSPYAVSKRVGEMYCRVFSQIFGLETVSLRYFNIFGPRQDPLSHYAAVVPNFINRLLKDENPVIFGDGEQSRDFTYVANVVEANILASRAAGVSGENFNIACGERTTVKCLARRINEILGKDIRPLFDAPRPGDIPHSFADIARAKRMLRYVPSVSFIEGLRKTVSWYQDQEDKST